MVEALVANGVEHVVLDESTRVKNSRSETWKAVRALVEQGTSGKRRVESVIAASGNPMPNSPVDIWAQIRLLLGPRPFGSLTRRRSKRSTRSRSILSGGR